MSVIEVDMRVVCISIARDFALILHVVKLVFSFCAKAKFKDITCIVYHHYHVFHVPRPFYSVNKSCSIVF